MFGNRYVVKTVQIDLDQRFLSQEVEALGRSYIIDQIFNPEGKLIDYRSILTGGTGVRRGLLTRSDIDIGFNAPEKLGPEESFMFSINFPAVGVRSPFVDDLVFFSAGSLKKIALFRAMIQDGYSYNSIIWVVKHDVEKLENWEIDLGGPGEIIKQEKPNEFIYTRKGKELLNLQWRVQEGEGEEEGNKGPFLVIFETDFITDIVRSLKTPLRVDISKIEELLSAKAPYKKDARGNFIIPWRNIDRIVGASLSYSYPPPTSQK